MKISKGVIIGVVLGLLILIIAVILVVQLALRQPAPPAPAPSNSQSTTATPVKPESGSTLPAQTATTTTSSPSPSVSSPTGSAQVDFSVQITNISGSNLTRNVTGVITNNGQADAHNVTATLQVYSGGKLIKVNGQDSVVRDLGTIQAGKSITTQVEMSFGLLDGPTLLKNGATINLKISSDEKTQTISYDYRP